ncbi:MAG: methyltransferase domain-containing protein [archaeon]|nr:methyltransferase domain-containing protein [archaeon]
MLKTSVNLLICDSHNLPAKDKSFDATICKFALWPLKDVERGIKEMIRVTKPNGKIVIVEVDRTDNSRRKSGVHWKIKYPVCKMLNFLTRERSRKLPTYKRMEEGEVNMNMQLMQVLFGALILSGLHVPIPNHWIPMVSQ